MKKLSKVQSYEEIGENCDTHDLAGHWEETKPAKFKVDIQSEVTYYAVEREVIRKGKTFAKQQGISPDKGLVGKIAIIDKFKQNSGRHGSIRTHPLLSQCLCRKRWKLLNTSSDNI